MELNEYQKAAKDTAQYPKRDGLSYTALGLAGEAGEIANKVKKVIRDNGGRLDSKRSSDLVKELGDVLWYVAMVAEELDTNLEEVAIRNLLKLQKRAEAGTIKGDGDNR